MLGSVLIYNFTSRGSSSGESTVLNVNSRAAKRPLLREMSPPAHHSTSNATLTYSLDLWGLLDLKGMFPCQDASDRREMIGGVHIKAGKPTPSLA